MKQLLTVLSILCILGACNTNTHNSSTETSPLKEMNWILGEWIGPKQDNQLYEYWTKANDSFFLGKSLIIANQKDTLYNETTQLIARQNQLYYISLGANQGPEQIREFKLDSANNKEWIFENLEIDYPQRIIYQHPSTDSLHGIMEGKVDGQPYSIDYSMSRK